MGMSFAEYLAAAQAAEKSGMSGKDFVKQQRQQQIQKEASQTFNYGIRNTNTYRPPAPPPQQPQKPTVVIQPPTTPSAPTGGGTPSTGDGGDGGGDTTGGGGGDGGGGGGGPTTPTVGTNAEEQGRLNQQIADMQAWMAEQAKAQDRAMQLMVSQYKAAQQQAAEAAERQRRQMQIAQAYGQSDPADVRFSRSRAQRAGMVSAGVTGTFGRQGLRIRNLNIPTGRNASRNNTAGSFA